MVRRLTKLTRGGVTRFVTLPYGQSPPPVGGGDPARVMLSSNGLRYMGLPGQSSSATFTHGTSEVVTTTPPWGATTFYLAFTNWGVRTDGTQVAPVPEYDGSAPLLVEAKVSADDGVTWHRVTFAGANRVSIDVGGTTWGTFTLPQAVTNRRLLVRTFRKSVVSQIVPVGYRITAAPALGGLEYASKGVRYTSVEADALALLDGGTLTFNGSGSFSFFYGPAAMAVVGWDGREVCLLVGDSIGAGSGATHLDLAMRESSGVGSYPTTNMCAHGTKPGNSTGNTTGKWLRRDQLLRTAAALDPQGRTPFTFILSQMGVNSAGDSDLVNTQMPAWWTHLRQYGTRLYQAHLTPKTTSTTFWTDNAGQTVVADNRWLLNASLAGRVTSGALDGVVDYVTTVCDPAGDHKWYVPPTTTTLAADSTGNTLVFTDNVGQGMCPVFDVGGTTFHGSQISSVVPDEQGRFVATASGLAGTFPAGTVVRFAITDDGTHPGDEQRRRMTEPLVAAKNAGLFEAAA